MFKQWSKKEIYRWFSKWCWAYRNVISFQCRLCIYSQTLWSCLWYSLGTVCCCLFPVEKWCWLSSCAVQVVGLRQGGLAVMDSHGIHLFDSSYACSKVCLCGGKVGIRNSDSWFWFWAVYFHLKQCCGSGMRCFFTPGFGTQDIFLLIPDLWSWTSNPYFWELRDNFLGKI